MAFTVEDGTGLSNSNALIDVAFADAYFSDRGITAWTGDADTVKKPAIVRATDYLCNRFRFMGEKYNDNQALEFPRKNVPYYQTGVALMPEKMRQAIAEYALRALTQTLAPDPVVDDTGGKIVEKREKLGPLEEATRYAEGIANVVLRPYPAADMLLRGLVYSSAQVIR
jgi:hypothetical protein